MQQIGPSCKCIYIPTPSACGENPFLMPWTGRKPCLHFSALSSASGLMGCTCCFPQQSSASCFGAGRVREPKFSLAGGPTPRCKLAHHGAEGPGIPPRGPAAWAALPATPRAAAEVGEGGDGTIWGDSFILRADAHKLFVKFPSHICH